MERDRLVAFLLVRLLWRAIQSKNVRPKNRIAMARYFLKANSMQFETIGLLTKVAHAANQTSKHCMFEFVQRWKMVTGNDRAGPQISKTAKSHSFNLKRKKERRYLQRPYLSRLVLTRSRQCNTQLCRTGKGKRKRRK